MSAGGGGHRPPQGPLQGPPAPPRPAAPAQPRLAAASLRLGTPPSHPPSPASTPTAAAGQRVACGVRACSGARGGGARARRAVGGGAVEIPRWGASPAADQRSAGGLVARGAAAGWAGARVAVRPPAPHPPSVCPCSPPKGPLPTAYYHNTTLRQPYEALPGLLERAPRSDGAQPPRRVPRDGAAGLPRPLVALTRRAAMPPLHVTRAAGKPASGAHKNQESRTFTRRAIGAPWRPPRAHAHPHHLHHHRRPRHTADTPSTHAHPTPPPPPTPMPLPLLRSAAGPAVKGAVGRPSGAPPHAPLGRPHALDHTRWAREH